MYQLKKRPEDFVVKEIAHHELHDSGKFAICALKKRNYTTIRAIEKIAQATKKKLTDIGFAGTKDKNAITEQYISIRKISKETIDRIKLKDISLEFLGYKNVPISLGQLETNDFTITIRNISEKDLRKERLMPNYFGEQRFSKHNREIGKLILKQKFKEATKLIIKTNPDCKIEEFLKKSPNNYIDAIQLIPIKILKLYIHAYQSYLWNKTLYRYTGKKAIPLLGFGTEIRDSEIRRITDDIMKEESLDLRDFIVRKIPNLSAEGSTRKSYVDIKNFQVLETNPIKVSFQLEKGSYATVAIAFLLDSIDSVLKNCIR